MKVWIAGSTIAFVLATAVGWGTAGNRGKPQDEITRQPAKSRDRPDAAGRNDSTRALLSRLRKIENPEELAKAALSLVESMSHDELADWLLHQRFRPREGMAAELFRQAARERCLRECPELLLEPVGKGYADPNAFLRGEALEVIARRDPEQALAWMRGRPAENVELAALKVLAATHPDEVIQRIVERYVADGEYLSWSGGDSRVLLEIARHDPAALVAAAGELPGKMKTQAEGALALMEWERDPDGGLATLLARADGWQVFAMASSMSDQNDLMAFLIPKLAELPPGWRQQLVDAPDVIRGGHAGEWVAVDFEAAGFSDVQASRMRQKALLAMVGAGDREAALAVWQQSPPMAVENLQQFLSYVFDENDPQGNEALLAGIADKSLREQARGFIGQQDAAENTGPRAVADWDEDAMGAARQAMSWGAEAGAVEEARGRFHAMEDSERREVAVGMVESFHRGGSAQQELYGEALRVLAEDPGSSDEGLRGRGVEYRATVHAFDLFQTDATRAADWVDSLPAGEVRDSVRTGFFERWKNYDPTAAQRWWDAGE